MPPTPNSQRYIITQERTEGDRVKHIEYLTDSLQRRQVTIDQSFDTPEIRHAIGEALANGNVGNRRKGRR